MLLGNAGAIVTDAFPVTQRGMALGIQNIAGRRGHDDRARAGRRARAGVLAADLPRVRAGRRVRHRLGVSSSCASSESGGPARIDWWGNLTFAVGLVALMVGITTGIQPYGHHAMSWTSPRVIGEIGGGVFLLALFALIESRVAEPLFQLSLFRVRAFTAGNIASLLMFLARGGLQFVLVIWLQGIWLPEHGYSFSSTPFWAGIHMLPLVGGLLLAGPLSGMLSDRFGARPFATLGALLAALSFFLLARVPVDFSYPAFAVLPALNGVGVGLFVSPNRAAIMNSVPPWRRGVGSGMASTATFSAQVLSVGVFFSLMIVGLSSALPATLYHGLTHTACRTPSADAHRPPAARLEPLRDVPRLQPGRAPARRPPRRDCPPRRRAILTGHSFFPQLITKPFSSALNAAFTFACASACSPPAPRCCAAAATAGASTSGCPADAPTPRRRGRPPGDRGGPPAIRSKVRPHSRRLPRWLGSSSPI